MIYRITFTHAPDYEFVLASVKSMARLHAWNQIGGIFLFVDPTRSFTKEQFHALSSYKCIFHPTPLMTGPFTGVTFNWSWEGIYDQILAYKWVTMGVNLQPTDYVMRADSDTVFTSSRFLTHTNYGDTYIGKGNEQTWQLANGPFRPTEGPCNLMSADTLRKIAGLEANDLRTLHENWPGLPLVDDVFYSYYVSQAWKSPPEPNPIRYYDSEWYTGTTVEEFHTYLANGQHPGSGFMFHWLGHFKRPVLPLLSEVNWLPEV